VEAGGPYDFTSAWKSAGTGDEWVYVDLGAVCTFDRVALAWIQRAAGANWMSPTMRYIGNTALRRPLAGDMKLASPARGRYVRLL
jgi:hypothetical protein